MLILPLILIYSNLYLNEEVHHYFVGLVLL